MDNTFDKSLVLSKQTAIDGLFHGGKRVRNSVFTIIHQNIPFLEVPFQVLVSVPKRKIKKAVNRNYLKRCISLGRNSTLKLNNKQNLRHVASADTFSDEDFADDISTLKNIVINKNKFEIFTNFKF